MADSNRMDQTATIHRLARTLLHEINSPLTALLLTTDVLERALDRLEPWRAPGESLMNELRRGVRLIAEAGLHMQEISSEYNRPTSPREEPPATAVDVGATLEASLDLAAPQLGGRARVVLEIERDLPEIRGSSRHLGQVFLNLLVNAAQAMDSGDGATNEVHVSGRRSEDGAGVIVDISDTGRGIPPEVLPQLFRPFFTTRRETGGHGLGLWISRDLVLRMGGELTAQPRSGTGMTFRVRLPALEASAAALPGGEEHPEHRARPDEALARQP